MKLGIRAKLFAASLALILVSLAAGELYLRPAIEGDLVARIRADLSARLALVAEQARVLAATGDDERTPPGMPWPIAWARWRTRA